MPSLQPKRLRCRRRATVDSDASPNPRRPRFGDGRRAALVGLSAAAAIALAGCGGSSSGAGTSTGTASGPAGKPVYGGNVTEVHYEPITNTWNHLTEFYLGSIWPIEAINENLTFVDGAGKPEPVLATSWSVSPSNLVWTFHIRPGVHFTSGKPLTAADVAFSLEQMQRPTAIYHYLYATVKSVKATGPLTVQIALTSPNPDLPLSVSNYTAAIIPANWGGESEAAFNQHPIGTGPFMLASTKDRVPGVSVTLVRNPHYWQPGLPYLSSITFKLIDDENERVLQLKGGQAQLMDFAAPDQASVALESGSSGVHVENLPAENEEYLLLSQKSAPLRDPLVRLAIGHAIDRAAIVKSLLFGRGHPGTTYLNDRFTNLYDPSAGLTYDPALAKQEIAKSTHPHGFTISMLTTSGSDLLTELVQQELAPLGITVQLKPVDTATLGNDENTLGYDLAVQPYGMTSGDPLELTGAVTDPSVLNDFFTGFKDTALAAMAKQAESATGAKRAGLFDAVQKRQAQDAYVESLFYIPQPWGMSDKLHGLRFGAGFNLDLSRTWLSK